MGIFPPNAFGIYDLHGNVWEWCEDDWHRNYQGKDRPDDGTAWLSNDSSEKTNYKILRGGSWYYNPFGCRSAFRIDYDPRDNDFIIGFRLVCELPRAL